MPQSMQAQSTKCSSKQVTKCKATCNKTAASETQAVGLFTSLTDGEQGAEKKAVSSNPAKCNVTKCTPKQMAKCKAVCKKSSAKASKVAIVKETPKSTLKADLR